MRVSNTASVSSALVKDIFRKIPTKILNINHKLDGSFPAHPSNPMLPESTKQLEKAVVQHKANFGILFDGDADRIVFVDDKGNVVLGSLIAALIADDFVKKGRKTIVHDAMTSKIVKDVVGKRGSVIRTKVGYSYINKAMRKKRAVFGAEVSGHYCYLDNSY